MKNPISEYIKRIAAGLTIAAAVIFMMSLSGCSSYTYVAANRGEFTKVYDVVRFEEVIKGKQYKVDITGKVYFTQDSLAVYLYEHIMEYLVLHCYQHESGMVYSAKIPRVRKEYKFWFYGNILFIEQGEAKYRVYLSDQICPHKL